MDPYRVLGIPPGSDAAAVRAAYLDAVRRWHPDRDPGDAARERFLAAQQAYDRLTDAAGRPRVDGRAPIVVRPGRSLPARLRRAARTVRRVLRRPPAPSRRVR